MRDITQPAQQVQDAHEQQVEELAGPDDYWLTITDAARATRRQDVSIRRWIAKGLLPVRRQNVGLNQRTRLVRASDLAKLTPIIDPAGAISTERGRLDLTSIPVQQAQIKTAQQQITARLEQLARDIQNTSDNAMQLLREQETQQAQALSDLRIELKEQLARQYETLSNRVNDLDTALNQQRESLTHVRDELLTRLDRQQSWFEQAIEQAQTSIIASETILLQHVSSLRERVEEYAEDHRRSLAEVRQHVDEQQARLQAEIEQREQLAQFVVQLASTVTSLEQTASYERRERQRLEQQLQSVESSMEEARAGLERASFERIALNEQLAHQTIHNTETHDHLARSLSQLQNSLTSLQEQVTSLADDYRKYIIRRYRSADHDEVWELHKLALQEAGAFAGKGPWNDDLHQIERVYLHDGGEFLVGVCNSRIVAMGAFRRTGDERAEIKRMRVHPEYQRRGFGQLILQELEAQALAMGFTTLHLDTTTVQTAAQNLYRKNGYHETGETRETRGGTAIFFEKRIR